MTSPPEDGRGAALAMRNALLDAGINLSDVDYINAGRRRQRVTSPKRWR